MVSAISDYTLEILHIHHSLREWLDEQPLVHQYSNRQRLLYVTFLSEVALRMREAGEAVTVSAILQKSLYPLEVLFPDDPIDYQFDRIADQFATLAMCYLWELTQVSKYRKPPIPYDSVL